MGKRWGDRVTDGAGSDEPTPHAVTPHMPAPPKPLSSPDIPDGTSSDLDDLQPTLTVDVIARWQAGALDPHMSSEVSAGIDNDPQAQRILAALDATTQQLRSAPVAATPPPPHIQARLNETLAHIRDDATVAPATESADPTAVDDASDIAVVDFVQRHARNTESRRRRGILIATAAAAVVAVITFGIAIFSSVSNEPSSDSVAQNDSLTSQSAIAPVALLSVLGKTDPALGSPTQADSAIRQCLVANKIAPTVPVVGAGQIRLQGQPRWVILLGTGVAGRFDALVTGTDCGPNNPALISQTIIGR